MLSFVPDHCIFLLFIACSPLTLCASVPGGNHDEELQWSHGNIPDGATKTLRGLLSTDEFDQLHRLGVIERGFVIRFAQLSEIGSLSMRTIGPPNAYIVWSRRAEKDWAPLRTTTGDRKIFRAGRKLIRQPLLDRVQSLVAKELLFLPLRSSVAYKPTPENIRLKYFGRPHNANSCHCFDGSRADQLVYDLRRRGAITQSQGDFSFYMKTRAYNGVIFSSHGTQGDFVLVQIRKARLMVVVNFGGNQPRSLTASMVVNDGAWHKVSVHYLDDDCTLYIDGVRAASSPPPLMGYRLDLDAQMEIGGAPFAMPYMKYRVADNFTGCLEAIRWNTREILRSGKVEKCGTVSAQGGSLLAFTDGNAWIARSGRSLQQYDSDDAEHVFTLRVAGRCRTVSKEGRIWRTGDTGKRWSDSLANFSLSLVEGVISCRMLLDGELFTLKSHQRVDDGLWHSFKFKLQSHLVELIVDEQPAVRLEAKFKILSPPDEAYVLGGDGFLGCIEDLMIDGRNEDLRQHERRWKDPTGQGLGIVWDRCPVWDRCHPNPCTNGGSCHGASNWNGFFCVCQPGYSGRLCSNVDLPHSCQEYRQFSSHHFQTSTVSATIDLDDVGPLSPLRVQCGLDGSLVLAHDRIDPVEVYGFPERGSAVIDYKYSRIDRSDARGSLSVSALAKRSKECRQEMKYKCFGGAGLMRASEPSGNKGGPSSWWISWGATHVYAWGDGQPDSRMCPCAVHGTCSGGRTCNCDGISETEDAGNVTRKELLPIRRVLAGDTDFSDKRAMITVGPLVCNGDESSDPITFLQRNAFVEIPFEPAYSADKEGLVVAGYLQFLTRECLISFLSTSRGSKEDDDDGCEYLQLHVEDCRTAVLLICGAGGLTKVTSNFSQPIDTGSWHSIKFVVTTTSVTLVLDNQETNITTVDHLYSSPVVGAIHSWRLGSTGDSGSGFTGVVRSVFLNGHLVSGAKVESAGRLDGAVQVGLVNRCVSMDEYGAEDGNSYCFNNGQCEELYYTVKCDCSATPFTGSRCQQDVSYDLVGSLTFSSDLEQSAPVSYLRMGFQTITARSALLRGFDKRTKTDVLALLLTDTGTLRLLYTDNYTPFTVEDDGRNYADGYFHDVIITVNGDNRSISLEVDHWRTRKLEFRHPVSVRTSLMHLDWIVGDEGCISRLQIGHAFFPFKSFGAMLRASSDASGVHYRKSVCPAISDNVATELEPPWQAGSAGDGLNTVSSWLDLPRVKVRPLKQPHDRSIILGGVGAAAACVVIIIMCCLVRFCRSRPAGEYKTHEETLYMSGPVSGHDSSQQALVSVVGGEVSPSPVERREWFI